MKTGIYWQDPKYTVGRHDTDPSCVLYLPLHRLDGASFMSKDAYGHLCAVTGALWTPPGRNFDGQDDYIDCGNGASLRITSEITIIGWLKKNTSSDSGDLLSKSSAGGTTTRGISLNISATTIELYVSPSGGGTGAKAVISTGTLDDIHWHQVAAVFVPSTKMDIFIDGLLDTSDTSSIPAAIHDTAANVLVGARYGGDNLNTYVGDWTGLINEVAIYNRALTPLEIQHNYLASKWRYR